MSHLRFGSAPISAPYCIEQADYLAVHVAPYMQVRAHPYTCCASGHIQSVCVGWLGSWLLVHVAPVQHGAVACSAVSVVVQVPDSICTQEWLFSHLWSHFCAHHTASLQSLLPRRSNRR